MEVRSITGGALPTFPPKLALLEALLGTEREFEPLADENNEEACTLYRREGRCGGWKSQ
jgi:hypothetical protein